MRKLGRRALLRGGLGGGVAGALGLFPWLDAAAASSPTRLLLLFTPHGTVWNQWRPIGGETDFAMSYILEPLSAFREQMERIDDEYIVYMCEEVILYHNCLFKYFSSE